MDSLAGWDSDGYGHGIRGNGVGGWPHGNAENGERVYRTNCLNCHGAIGRGDGPVAESLTPRPADFTTETVQNKSEKELLKIIREGKPGTSMPSWKGELSDQHIQDVLVYLRGFGGKTRKAGGSSFLSLVWWSSCSCLA